MRIVYSPLSDSWKVDPNFPPAWRWVCCSSSDSLSLPLSLSLELPACQNFDMVEDVWLTMAKVQSTIIYYREHSSLDSVFDCRRPIRCGSVLVEKCVAHSIIPLGFLAKRLLAKNVNTQIRTLQADSQQYNIKAIIHDLNRIQAERV